MSEPTKSDDLPFIEETLPAISLKMAGALSHFADTVRDVLSDCEDEIRALRDAGDTITAIAEALGLDPDFDHDDILPRVKALMRDRAELDRYSMDAGRADQYRSEAMAARRALGFDADSDEVSPSDLVAVICRAEADRNRLQAERNELLAMTQRLDEHPQGYDGPCSCKLCMSYADAVRAA